MRDMFVVMKNGRLCNDQSQTSCLASAFGKNLPMLVIFDLLFHSKLAFVTVVEQFMLEFVTTAPK